MQSFNLVFNTLLPVFLIVLVGYFIGKKKKIDIESITNLIIYISAPALILASLSKSQLSLENFSIIALAAVLIILIQAMVFFILVMNGKSKKTSLYPSAIIGNTAFLGYPIALFVFNNAGLSSAIIYDLVNSLFLFTLGIFIISRKKKFSEVFKFPIIFAVLVGLLLKITNTAIPSILLNPLELIGAITIPAALLVLGYNLTKMKISSLSYSFKVALFRIAGGFLVGLFVTFVLSISGVIRSIVLLQSSMPSAVMTMILAQKYNRDSELVASVVLISTIMSLFSIPLIILFLSSS